MIEQVKSAIRTVMKRPGLEIPDDAGFIGDLGMDSIDVVEVQEILNATFPLKDWELYWVWAHRRGIALAQEGHYTPMTLTLFIQAMQANDRTYLTPTRQDRGLGR